MIGFAAGVAAEVSSQQPILEQLAGRYGGVGFFSLLILVGSLMPKFTSGERRRRRQGRRTAAQQGRGTPAPQAAAAAALHGALLRLPPRPLHRALTPLPSRLPAAGVSLAELHETATAEALKGGEGVYEYLSLFNGNTELWTGRIAMLGLSGLVALEVAKGDAFF
jgi:hypothetical protein